MELPSHPERSDTTPDPQTSSSRNRAGVVVVVVLGAFLLLIVLLHLTGVVGPAAR